MKLLTLILILLTFLLINLGGHVHNTGSSLACPDWPLCYGQLMPEMVGGVMIEHSHRLLAGLVGFLTLIIALLARKNCREVKISYVALAMVIVQGVLGGITVIYKLPTFVSTAHLGLSMIFICGLIYLHHRLALPEKVALPSKIKPYLMLALVLLYVQIMLGALMRHLGLGAVCGVGHENSLLCLNQLVPIAGAQQLHMAHRLLALISAIAILIPNLFILKKAQGKFKLLPSLVLIIIPLQIFLGIMTVSSGLQSTITMLHLGGAALLLMVIWKEYLYEVGEA